MPFSDRHLSSSRHSFRVGLTLELARRPKETYGISTNVRDGRSWHCRRAFSGIENSWRTTGHGEGLTDHAPSPRRKSFFQGRTSPTSNPLRWRMKKVHRKLSVR